MPTLTPRALASPERHVAELGHHAGTARSRAVHPRARPPSSSACALSSTTRKHFCGVFSCTGHCHDESDSLPHTGTCAVCGKLSDLSCLSPVQENTPQKCTTLLTGAEDGGAAVGLHDGRGRGLGARGAGLDEHDGLARLSAAEGRGRARNVPERVFFRIPYLAEMEAAR